MAQDGILYPLENFNFMLRIEGFIDLPCKSVHGFNREKEYEYIQEGGVNDYVHMKRKPITKPYTFTVERYVASDPLLYDPLQEGTELLLPVLLFVTRFPGKFVTTRRVYTFTGCTVISKEYGELNAERPGLLVEKAVISYRELVTVTTFDDVDTGTWSIQEAKDDKKAAEKNRKAVRDYSKGFTEDEEGNITDKRVSRWDIKNPKENRKATQNLSVDFNTDENGNVVDGRAGQWTIDPSHPQGIGKQSARTYEKPKEEAGKESAFASKWDIKNPGENRKATKNFSVGKESAFARKWEINSEKNPNAKSVRSALTRELIESLQK